MAKSKKKTVRKPMPIRTRYGNATLEKSYHHKGMMDVKTISTGAHPLAPYVFEIEEVYQHEDVALGIAFNPNVVIRDYVEDQKILKKMERLEKKVRELRVQVRVLFDSTNPNEWHDSRCET